MYELLILSLLMRWPLHGYVMTKIMNNILGPEETISRGTLSTLLSRLRQTGLITWAVSTSGPGQSRHDKQAYQVTPAGRKRFEELMLAMPDRAANYSRRFHIKALHLDLMPGEQSRALVEHYQEYCWSIIREKEADILDFSNNALKQSYIQNNYLREAALAVMRLKTRQWRAEEEWAEELEGRITQEFGGERK